MPQSAIERFVYQKPDAEQVQRIEEVRRICAGLAGIIAVAKMDERCRSLALTKLEEVSMWANKGIVFSPAEVAPGSEVAETGAAAS